MAVKRMVHCDILRSDSFLSMPHRTQMLYVQICLASDDDGFFNGAEALMRVIGAKKPDLKMLVERRFLLQFDKVVVVKHWRMANCLKNDRMKPLSYPKIAEKIYIKPNRAYTDHPVPEGENLLQLREQLLAQRNPNGIPGEEREGEEKIGKHNLAAAEADGIRDAEKMKLLHGSLGKGVLMLTEEQMDDLMDKMGLDAFDYYTDKLSAFILEKNARVRNHYEKILQWWQEDSRLKGV